MIRQPEKVAYLRKVIILKILFPTLEGNL